MKNILALAFIALSPSLHAADCSGLFVGGQPPLINNALLQQDVYQVCHAQFASLYSGRTHTGVYSAEVLTREDILSAYHVTRHDAFHPDDQLPSRLQEEVRGFGFGLDRGHLAPSGDMANASNQYESFSLANIVPQDAYLNRHQWEKLEASVRHLGLQHQLYVVTGGAFTSQDRHLAGGHEVPAYMFKAVYDSIQEKAVAYVTANTSNAPMQVISLQELQNISGIDAFPALPASLHQQQEDLLNLAYWDRHASNHPDYSAPTHIAPARGNYANYSGEALLLLQEIRQTR